MRGRAPRSMVRYRIVDDRDGSVLAEHASPERALRSFGPLVCDPHIRARVSVVRLDHAAGGMTHVTSMRSARSLCRAAGRSRSR